MIRRVIALAVTLGIAFPAYAHTVGEAGAEPIFTLDLKVVLPLGLSLALYLTGVLHLWARAGIGRAVRHWQVRCFTGGWALLVVALVTPLHWLGERLFVAHMVEHEILMVVAAPLLVVARPFPAFVWGLPRSLRQPLGRFLQGASKRPVWRIALDQRSATALHGIAIWGWHLPAAFDLALSNPWIHWLQHLSFLLSAMLFWWALLRDHRPGLAYGTAIVMLFITALHSGLLGILLTLARHPLYPAQTTAMRWGLTALEDQQAAGLAMWIPPGLIYAVAALALFAFWMARPPPQREWDI
jgi:putative membrane protein